MYNQLHEEEFSDDLSNEEIVEEFDKDSIIKRACEYPTSPDTVLYYPGKAYAIAIMAAKYLEEEYNEEILEVLDDPDLLYGNDPYFVPYSRDKDTYDKILNSFPFAVLKDPATASENCRLTLKYIAEEFGEAE